MNKNLKYIVVFIIIILAVLTYFILNKKVGSDNLNTNENVVSKTPPRLVNFENQSGTSLVLEDGKVQIEAISLDDGIAKLYNVIMPSGKTIYFFAVKDQFGIYRAAANACEVCFGQKKGFRQEGNKIICNNCGSAYSLEKIATEKGGCNPGPINPDLKVVGGEITITQKELEQVANLF